MSNIYEKLQDCKSELQGMNLKKTGKNAFAKYDYWELSDYLPTVISLFKQHKLFSYFSFGLELATLTIINSEQPEESISLTSPMAAADLKGCHAIQNMGAVETYQRRYLYMAALDISEPDALDGTQGKPDKPQGQPPKPQQNAAEPPMSKETRATNLKVIEMLIKSLKLTPEYMSKNLEANYKVATINDLSDVQISKVLVWLNGKKNASKV